MESLAASSFLKTVSTLTCTIPFKTGISATLRDKPHPEFGNLNLKKNRPKLN